MRRRRQPPPDAYEYAARRGEADRRSRALGDPLPPPAYGLDLAPFAPRLRRQAMVLGGVLLLLVLGGMIRNRPTPADCAAPRLALSAGTVARGETLRWTATGPRGTAVAVELDGRRVSQPGVTLADCRAAGFLVIDGSAGQRTVQLVDPGSGRVLATARVQVTG